MATQRDGERAALLVGGSGRRLESADLVDEPNIVLTWLGDPGRAGGTALAESFDFSRPAASGC